MISILSKKNFMFILSLCAISIMAHTQEEQSCGDDFFEVNLRSPGQPLDQARVQNQGEIGTCYANVAALMIESQTRQAPSFTQIALAYGDQVNRLDREILTIGDTDLMISEGGNPCSAYNVVMQKHQMDENYRLCLAASVPLDNPAHFSSREQRATYTRMSRILNELNQNGGGGVTSNGQIMAFDQQSLNEIAEMVERNRPRHECIANNPSFEGTPPFAELGITAISTQKELRKRCLRLYQNIENETEVQTSQQALELLGTIERSATGAVQCQLHPRIINYLNSQYLENIYNEFVDSQGNLAKEIPSFMLTPSSSDNYRSQQELFNFILSSAESDCPDCELYIFLPANFATDIERIVPQTCREMRARPLRQLISTTEMHRYLCQQERCYSTNVNNENTQNLLEQTRILEQLINQDPGVVPLIQNLLEYIQENSDQLITAEDAMMNAMAPNCQQNGIELSELSNRCISVSTNYLDRHAVAIMIREGVRVEELARNDPDRLHREYQNTRLRARRLHKRHNYRDYLSRRNELREQVNGLWAGESSRVIGVDVNLAAFTGVYGMHSMGLIGQRCVNGRVQYYLQDSYGEGHCAASTEHIQSGRIQCDQENGAMWVDESLLIEGINRISYIE